MFGDKMYNNSELKEREETVGRNNSTQTKIGLDIIEQTEVYKQKCIYCIHWTVVSWKFTSYKL